MRGMNWLFKEEPTHYGYDDFLADGKIYVGTESGKFFIEVCGICGITTAKTDRQLHREE